MDFMLTYIILNLKKWKNNVQLGTFPFGHYENKYKEDEKVVKIIESIIIKRHQIDAF